jgi:hypothetical protein
MRKLLLSFAAMVSMASLVFAANVTVSKYDKDTKSVTVKDGDAEKTYKFSDSVKVTIIDKDGKETEGKFEDLEKRLSRMGKGGGGGGGKGQGRGAAKLDITTEGEMITAVKYKAGRGKNQE